MTRLGAIADDLTGATDLALALMQAGYRTAVVLDEDVDDAPAETDAVVVALKSRTAPAQDAVRESLAALEGLQRIGCDRFFFKYCSTFDSTSQGNIGPVADALMDQLGESMTLVCPAFPANGRTVYQGHLFVGQQLLSDSPMRNHPLTPMTDSSIPRLLAPQIAGGLAGGSAGEGVIGVVSLNVVRDGAGAIRAALSDLRARGVRYAVVDATRDEDLDVIAEAAAECRLLTGGSALAQGLRGPAPDGARVALGAGAVRRIVLSGSASSATQRQVAYAMERGEGIRLDIPALKADFDAAVGVIVVQALAAPAQNPCVVYATARPEDVGTPEDAELIERALSAIAAELVDRGVDALVVAGGETSGAVVRALGVRSLHVGRLIDAGIAWSLARRPNGSMCRLALKSGNFGGDDFMVRAWEVLA